MTPPRGNHPGKGLGVKKVALNPRNIIANLHMDDLISGVAQFHTICM